MVEVKERQTDERQLLINMQICIWCSKINNQKADFKSFIHVNKEISGNLPLNTKHLEFFNGI